MNGIIQSNGDISPTGLQLSTITVAQAVELYAGFAVTHSSHAWKSWTKTFVGLWGSRPLASIGSADLNGFIAQKRKAGLADGSIRCMLATLRGVFRIASEAGAPVTWPKNIAKVAASRERVRFFKGDEEERLRKNMHSLDFEIVQLAASTGLRKSELWDLKRADVDLATKFLLVRNGKGRKSRTVPLGPTALKLLKKMMSRPGSVYVVNPLHHDHYKNRFTSCHVFMREVWRPALSRVGIEDFRWHDLRHEFASKLARAGKSLQVIKECLGHSNLDLTLRYSHLNSQSLLDGVSVI